MHTELDNLAFRFFKLFAQLEYGLKAIGYGKAGRNNAAEPDWDRFSNEIGCAIFAVTDLHTAAARDFILQRPPKRQVWVNNSVVWQDVPTVDQSAQALFAHIRRIRNNLYHGGKFHGRWMEPDRSRDLLSKALVILQQLPRLDSALAEAIRDNDGG